MSKPGTSKPSAAKVTTGRGNARSHPQAAPSGRATMATTPHPAMSVPMGTHVNMPVARPLTPGMTTPAAGVTAVQPGSPLSALLAVYSMTHLPRSTPQIQEIISNKATPEAQKVGCQLSRLYIYICFVEL